MLWGIATTHAYPATTVSCGSALHPRHQLVRHRTDPNNETAHHQQRRPAGSGPSSPISGPSARPSPTPIRGQNAGPAPPPPIPGRPPHNTVATARLTCGRPLDHATKGQLTAKREDLTTFLISSEAADQAESHADRTAPGHARLCSAIGARAWWQSRRKGYERQHG
jgi:hypothetical protein